MPTLLLSFDTGTVPLSRITDAFAKRFGYNEIINGAANPESKANFARRMVKEWITEIVKLEETTPAIETAKANITPIPLT